MRAAMRTLFILPRLIVLGCVVLVASGCWLLDLFQPPDPPVEPQDPVEYTFESGELDPWVLATKDGSAPSSGGVVGADMFDPEIAPAGGDYMIYITTLINEGVLDFGFWDENPDIDAFNNKEIECSGVSITFTTTVTSTVTVDLDFLSQEVSEGGVGSADVFGITTDTIQEGPYVLLLALWDDEASYGGTALPLTPSDFVFQFYQDDPWGAGYTGFNDQSQFNGRTGFHTYTFEVEPGEHTWTFFVADNWTDGVASAILIDNFAVTPNQD
jgi:hypothetical protein